MTDGARLLAEFLRRNELTQLAASRALSVSDPTIHDWVTGKKRPRAHHREAIAVWTSGEVPADSWLTEGERASTGVVRPFVPAAELKTAADSGEHVAFDAPAAKPTGTGT